MFTNTIYESVKQELDKYLFGFEKSQLETSLLSGKLTLCLFFCRPNQPEKRKCEARLRDWTLAVAGLPFLAKGGHHRKSSNPVQLPSNVREQPHHCQHIGVVRDFGPRLAPPIPRQRLRAPRYRPDSAIQRSQFLPYRSHDSCSPQKS